MAGNDYLCAKQENQQEDATLKKEGYTYNEDRVEQCRKLPPMIRNA